MSEQYFEKTPTSAHDLRQTTLTHAGRTLRFDSDAGVFSKGELDAGTALLIASLPSDFTGRALDLGCGWGVVGACMATQWPGAEIMLSDVNERAVELARKNVAANGLSGTVALSDGFFALEGTFDLIAVNPPIRAGKAVVYRLLQESADRLRAGGALFVVMRKQQGAESAQTYLQGFFQNVEIVNRKGGFRVMKATCVRESE